MRSGHMHGTRAKRIFPHGTRVGGRFRLFTPGILIPALAIFAIGQRLALEKTRLKYEKRSVPNIVSLVVTLHKMGNLQTREMRAAIKRAGIEFRDSGCYHPSVAIIVGGFMSDRNGGGVLWFLAGLGIGAVVGILYAPQSGSETRDLIMSKAEEGSEYVRKRAREAREQAGEWAQKGREAYGAQKEQIRSAVEAGRQAYREKTTAGKSGEAENV